MNVKPFVIHKQGEVGAKMHYNTNDSLRGSWGVMAGENSNQFYDDSCNRGQGHAIHERNDSPGYPGGESASD